MRPSSPACKTTFRKLLALCAASLVLLAPASLSATPITYNLTLTPGSGSQYGGTGSITIENAPRSSGMSDYTQANGKLDNLTFTLDTPDNQTFTLSGANGTTLVRFLNGQFNDITFAETIGAGHNRFTLDTTSGYAFYFKNGRAASYGTMSASMSASTAASVALSPASAPVSEPASLALFGTGLFASIGLLYRTRSPRHVGKATPLLRGSFLVVFPEPTDTVRICLY
jgi:hypothetical protein